MILFNLLAKAVLQCDPDRIMLKQKEHTLMGKDKLFLYKYFTIHGKSWSKPHNYHFDKGNSLLFFFHESASFVYIVILTRQSKWWKIELHCNQNILNTTMCFYGMISTYLLPCQHKLLWYVDFSYNKMTCAFSENSDQPRHLPSLISLSCPHVKTLRP